MLLVAQKKNWFMGRKKLVISDVTVNTIINILTVIGVNILYIIKIRECFTQTKLETFYYFR